MFPPQNAIKSYAFFDIIGVKRALKTNQGVPLLDKTWRAVDAWATSVSLQVWLLPPRLGTTPAAVRVATVSDSVFLTTEQEYKLESFYDLVDSLRAVLQKNSIPIYTILNRDMEISPSSWPALGCTVGNYHNITGVGPAWANIYLANEHIGRSLRKWHNRYNYYVIGTANVISKYPILEKVQFAGLTNAAVELCAIQ